jgi:hypothetical protein
MRAEIEFFALAVAVYAEEQAPFDRMSIQTMTDWLEQQQRNHPAG